MNQIDRKDPFYYFNDHLEFFGHLGSDEVVKTQTASAFEVTTEHAVSERPSPFQPNFFWMIANTKVYLQSKFQEVGSLSFLEKRQKVL